MYLSGLTAPWMQPTRQCLTNQGTGKACRDSWRGRSVVDLERRTELRDFLISRRARITPVQTGLTAVGGNRRVSGLRREELATLDALDTGVRGGLEPAAKAAVIFGQKRVMIAIAAFGLVGDVAAALATAHYLRSTIRRTAPCSPPSL